MNDNAKKWVAALRSGAYKQGVKSLCRNNYYCCLGVACEVFIQEGGELDKKQTGEYTLYHKEAYVLPEVVRDWLRLTTTGGHYKNNYNSLITFNDKGKSFEEIAKIIESEPEGLFKDTDDE